MGTAGTPRKLVLDGTSFSIIADADPQETPLEEKEYIATTGEPITKRTLSVAKVEGFKIACNAAERDLIDAIIASGAVPCSYTESDGSQRSSGAVDVMRGNRSLAEGTLELTLAAISPWVTL